MFKTELLSPAGNMKTLISAINNGADAIYVGGKMFGARAFADNFSNDELKEAEMAIERLGGEIEDAVELNVRGAGETLNHKAVIIRKVAPTPKAYPRKAGAASKKPIK